MTSTSTGYRHIVQSAGVRGGTAAVEGTRIGVHDVIGLLQNGETIDTLQARCFPHLSRAQIYECLAYYEDHRGEIDLLVAQQMAPDLETEASRDGVTRGSRIKVSRQSRRQP